ncbi:MAG: hypothetical protein AAFO81_06915 [Pseudomonadota bacterium]
MFNNKWVTIGLVAVAALFVYKRVVLTVVDEFRDSPVIVDADAETDLYLVETDDTGSGIETAAQGFKFSSAQRDLKRIDVAAISWNVSPARDPFAPQATLDTDAIQSVQAEIASATKARVTRSAYRVWPDVSAIVSSANHQYAVINGEIRRVGERFGHYRLQAVNAGSVSLVDLIDNRSQEVMVKP